MKSTSNNNNYNNSRNTTRPPTQFFCKVCQDAGKSEHEYRSHNVRDGQQQTCCPVLLAQECRHCYKKGHTAKYCPQKNKQPITTVKAAYVAPQKIKTNNVPKNVFMCLESDSEEEKEKEKEQEKAAQMKEKAKAPAPVPQAKIKAAQKQVMNYGRIIDLTPSILKTEENAAIIKLEKEAAEKKPMKIVVLVQSKKIDWAHCDSDSYGEEDDEDDNDEEYEVNMYEDDTTWDATWGF
jgi:hypothetical protein